MTNQPNEIEELILEFDTVRMFFAEEEEEEEEVSIIVSLKDITERKRAEKALIESENMYRTLLNASPEGIVIIDLRGRITEVSNITLEVFGVESETDFIGKNFLHFVPPEEIKKIRAILEKTQSEGLALNVEVRLTKRDQSQFISEISATLIQESDGKPKAFMVIIRDISQRKIAEQQMIRSERMANLGEMATAIAHEINQPLIAISLSLENILLKIDENQRVNKTYLKNKSNKIFENILRIGNIIDHVRTFSRDHDDYIFTSFDINTSINNALSMVLEQFRHKGIKLKIKLDKNIHPIIGNTYKFEQVILNLLINAKDAVEEKMRTSNQDFKRTIEIRTYHDDQTNYVKVKDNGIGIKPEVIDKIMLPFYTTKEAGKGTGLGLSISFGIIKELKGSIDVESNPLSGTTFRITLPIIKVKKK